MILSGHQPVYIPWLGLFHKISLCDTFIFMDTVQYLQQDWNNRNKIKTASGGLWLTVPVSVKKNQLIMLNKVKIAEHILPLKKSWQMQHWRSIENNYRKTPYFNDYADFFETTFLKRRWLLLNDLNEHILKYFLNIFELNPQFIKMSDHLFKGEKSDLILNQCIDLKANIIVLGTHGRDYIRKEDFFKNNIKIYFQNYNHPKYNQRHEDFLPYMSVLDLLFNEGKASFDIIKSCNITKQDILEGNYLETV